MKKITVLAVFCFAAFSIHAQEKVNKTNVVGKWGIYSAESPSMFYYNFEKDSLTMGGYPAVSIKDNPGIAMMKQELDAAAKVSFIFRADGTLELTTPKDEKKPGTYMVDEENSTITVVHKNENDRKQIYKIRMFENGKKMEMIDSLLPGNPIFVFKKVSG